MPAEVYMLTEQLDIRVVSGDGSLLPHSTFGRIYPGLVAGKYMRDVLGPRTFTRALETGVLVPRLYAR